MCEMAIKQKVSEQFVAWVILRRIDQMLMNGTGRVVRSKSVHLLSQMMGTSERTIQRVIMDGMRMFWRDGGNGFLYLTGIRPLCLLMGVKTIFSKWFIIPMGMFSRKMSEMRAILTCCVAAKDERPVSVENLVRRLGLSERTIHNHLKIGTGGPFQSTKNVLSLCEFDDEVCARDKLFSLANEGIPVEIVERDDGSLMVCRRLPNTWRSELQREGVKRVRKRLKEFIGDDPTQKKFPRLYVEEEGKGPIVRSDVVRNRFRSIHGSAGEQVEIWKTSILSDG